MTDNFAQPRTDKNVATPRQQLALTRFVVRMRKSRFAEYRAKAGIATPIGKMSRAEAHKMLELIIADLEAQNE